MWKLILVMKEKYIYSPVMKCWDKLWIQNHASPTSRILQTKGRTPVNHLWIKVFQNHFVRKCNQNLMNPLILSFKIVVLSCLRMISRRLAQEMRKYSRLTLLRIFRYWYRGWLIWKLLGCFVNKAHILDLVYQQIIHTEHQKKQKVLLKCLTTTSRTLIMMKMMGSKWINLNLETFALRLNLRILWNQVEVLVLGLHLNPSIQLQSRCSECRVCPHIIAPLMELKILLICNLPLRRCFWCKNWKRSKKVLQIDLELKAQVFLKWNRVESSTW